MHVLKAVAQDKLMMLFVTNKAGPASHLVFINDVAAVLIIPAGMQFLALDHAPYVYVLQPSGFCNLFARRALACAWCPCH